MSAARKKSKRALPWWLQEDDDFCSTCSHTIAHRTEVYCLDCDNAICPICVQRTETVELICPGCSESRNSEAEVS